jgi:putative chitinase
LENSSRDRESDTADAGSVDFHAGAYFHMIARVNGIPADRLLPANPGKDQKSLVDIIRRAFVITVDILLQIMPNLKRPVCESYFPFLVQAMAEFEINRPLREAAFLAQIAHESGEFRYLEEIWGPTPAQRRYEPPSRKARELGNEKPGDGMRYKGRGPIQITGRGNYRLFGEMLDLDLVNEPGRAADPPVAFRVAGAFWKTRGLNELADRQEFERITRRINGGLTGIEERRTFYERARALCGS